MKTIRFLLIAVVALISLASHIIAQSIPPAQGPDAPGANASSLPTALLTGLVKAEVERVIAETNENLANGDDIRAKLTFSFTEFAPRMNTTKYSDRPNERFAETPYIFSYTVSDIRKHTAVGWVSYPWTRKISQSISVNVSCKGWYAQYGELTASTDIDPLYLEPGHSISEQAVWAWMNGALIDLIDSRIRSELRKINIANVFTPLGLRCNKLGVATVAMGFPFNSIEFSANSQRTIPIDRFPILGSVTVRVLKIKRLQARTINNEILYQNQENIDVGFYVNHQYVNAGSFVMSENQEAVINHEPVRLSRPSNDRNIVLIFNVTQHDNSWTTDSDFKVHTSQDNFGNGLQNVQIDKTYWRPPTPPLRKPIKMYVAGYEITYEVSAPPPLVFERQD